jgi:hypothetical protein
MNRRQLLGLGALGAGVLSYEAVRSFLPGLSAGGIQTITGPTPTWAVIPVVGDGKWIWTEPPKDQTGYLEPRPFELSIGVEMQGAGDATQIKATTPIPVEHPEQKIDDVRIETEGCEARLQAVGEGAAQLLLAAPQIARGQTIRAIARYKLTLAKQYFGYERDQFPAKQPEAPAAIRKLYLKDSPGIQTSSAEVRRLAAQLAGQGNEHPWDLVQKFIGWIHENIRPQVGTFIGVQNALKRKTGDCEEMAGINVALARHFGIPARLVWVPNHNWSEIYLTDEEGQGHWIPTHTSCYKWFGWTGVHELVIQKGDRVTPAHDRKAQRLIEDWGQWVGRRPDFRWVADLKPLPPESPGSDAGPGARIKQTSGQWTLAGTHPMDRYMRNG